MDERELNYYGDFFDFIYWLVSDNESLTDKIKKLESLFSKMDESILKRFLPLLNNINIMINDDIEKKIREIKIKKKIIKSKKIKEKINLKEKKIKKRKKNHSPLRIKCYR